MTQHLNKKHRTVSLERKTGHLKNTLKAFVLHIDHLRADGSYIYRWTNANKQVRGVLSLIEDQDALVAVVSSNRPYWMRIAWNTTLLFPAISIAILKACLVPDKRRRSARRAPINLFELIDNEDPSCFESYIFFSLIIEQLRPAQILEILNSLNEKEKIRLFKAASACPQFLSILIEDSQFVSLILSNLKELPDYFNAFSNCLTARKNTLLAKFALEHDWALEQLRNSITLFYGQRLFLRMLLSPQSKLSVLETITLIKQLSLFNLLRNEIILLLHNVKNTDFIWSEIRRFWDCNHSNPVLKAELNALLYEMGIDFEKALEKIGPSPDWLLIQSLDEFENLKQLAELRGKSMHEIVNEKLPWDGGHTYPLHAAFFRKRYDFVYLLLENGADLNAQDSEQNTPLHVLLRSEFIHTDLLVAFLARKPNLDIPDKAGITARQILNNNKHPDYATFQYLKDKLHREYFKFRLASLAMETEKKIPFFPVEIEKKILTYAFPYQTSEALKRRERPVVAKPTSHRY